jgi:DnaD/phage-associated family protein
VINKHSPGFSTETEFTSLPNIFFTQLMPKIQDIAELKVTLYIFYLLNRKREYPRFITYRELLSRSTLMAGMEEGTLHHALNLAVGHGVILRATLDIDGKSEEAYFVNAESNREVMDNIKEGKFSTSKVMPQENIFTLYEQNVGMITPMIAEELKEAEKLYPEQWIKQAFREAVVMNKRNWRYIARILERWANEGKESGEHRRGTKESSPDKYIKGKYGHLVKR